jgi:hypothetical protein
MEPHVRVQMFCGTLLLAPLLFALGDKLAGLWAAIVLSALPVVAAAVHASLGERLGGGEPPVGTPPE